MNQNSYPNLLCFLEDKTQSMKSSVALGLNTKVGWKELTYSGISILSKNIAGYLIEKGIKKGDRVSIISESCVEWAPVLFGSVLAGATLVPIDIKLTIYEMKSILSNCQPRILLVSNKFIEYAKQLKEEIPSIEEIISINETSASREIKTIYELKSSSRRLASLGLM